MLIREPWGTFFTDPTITASEGIAAGPDGALWFTNAGNNSIGRITTSGTVSDMADPDVGAPNSVAAGSDHPIWFTNARNWIGRVTTSAS